MTTDWEDGPEDGVPPVSWVIALALFGGFLFVATVCGVVMGCRWIVARL